MSNRTLNDWDNIAKSLTKDDAAEEEEEEMDTLEALEAKMSKVPRGMFVSGWDDPDDLIEEDKEPNGMQTHFCCFEILN